MSQFLNSVSIFMHISIYFRYLNKTTHIFIYRKQHKIPHIDTTRQKKTQKKKKTKQKENRTQRTSHSLFLSPKRDFLLVFFFLHQTEYNPIECWPNSENNKSIQEKSKKHREEIQTERKRDKEL